MSGSEILWAICKSAPCSRQKTTPAPHRSVFYRPDALPAAQPTASKHWSSAYILQQNLKSAKSTLCGEHHKIYCCLQQNIVTTQHTRQVFTENFNCCWTLSVTYLLIALLQRVCLESLPWQVASEEIQEHVAKRFKVIATTLLCFNQSPQEWNIVKSHMQQIYYFQCSKLELTNHNLFNCLYTGQPEWANALDQWVLSYTVFHHYLPMTIMIHSSLLTMYNIRLIQGGPKKTDCFSDLITLWRLVLERRAVCQNFRNFMEKKVQNSHFNEFIYSLPNLLKSSQQLKLCYIWPEHIMDFTQFTLTYSETTVIFPHS